MSTSKTIRAVLLIVPIVLGGALWKLKPASPTTLPMPVSGQRLAVSPDGRYLVQGEVGWVGSVNILDTQTGTLSSQHPKITNSGDLGSHSLVPSPDSRYFIGTQAGVYSLMNTSIGVYDVTSESNFRVVGKGQVAGEGLACSASGEVLAFNARGELCFWDYKSGRQLKTWPASVFNPTQARTRFRQTVIPHELALSPDGKTLAIAGLASNGLSVSGTGGASKTSVVSYSNDLTLWDVRTQKKFAECEKLDYKQLNTFRGPDSWSQVEMTSLRFSPDGKWLATDSRGYGVVVWDAKTGKVKQILPHPPGKFHGYMYGGGSVVFSPDSQYVAAPGNQNAIDVWDVQTGTLKKQLDGRGPIVFLPDGRLVGGTAINGNLVAWPIS